MTSTETPAYMISNPVSASIARKAAEAGLTSKLTVDGLGRYHAGLALIEKRGSGWYLISDTGEWFPRTLSIAFQVAAQLNDARTAMLAKLHAMTADELQALILDPAADYTEVQYAMHSLYTAHGWKTLRTR